MICYDLICALKDVNPMCYESTTIDFLGPHMPCGN